MRHLKLSNTDILARRVNGPNVDRMAGERLPEEAAVGGREIFTPALKALSRDFQVKCLLRDMI
jgi:hypothetical protein